MTNTKKAFSVTLRGQLIDGAKIGTFKKAIGSVDEKLTLWANAAAAQYVIGGNRNWLDDLFSMDELRLTNGKLSAKGKSVAAYIKRFAPISAMEKEENGVQLIKIQLINPKKNKGLFFTGEKNDDGAPLAIDAASQPEWPLTLREFANLDKTPSKKSDTKKASTLENAINKMVESFTLGGVVVGSDAEIFAIAEAAEKLRQLAIAAMTEAPNALDGIEPVKAAEAASVTSRKETRADTNRAKHNKTAPEMPPLHASQDRSQRTG